MAKRTATTIALCVGAALFGLISIPSFGAFEEELSKGIGARPYGMGGAFVALSGDVDSIYWNPAGIALLSGWSFGGEYNVVNYNSGQRGFLGAAAPFGEIGSFGMSFGRFATRSPDWYGENNLTLAYAYPIERQWLDHSLYLGGNLKWISTDGRGGLKANGAGVDLGAIYNIPLEGYGRAVDFGLSLKNVPAFLGGDIDDHWAPAVVRLGTAYRLSDDVTVIVLDGTVNGGENMGSIPLGASLGAETWFYKGGVVALRGGYSFENLRTTGKTRFGEFTVGTSLNAWDWRIDYGLGFHTGLLNFVHRFSLGYIWAGFGAGREAEALKVSVASSPDSFSLSGVGSDSTIFHIEVSNPRSVAKWRLFISDGEGNIVKSFSGEGIPSENIAWNGSDDGDNMLLPGVYTYVLSVTDRKGIDYQSSAGSVTIKP
ncbi:MAG: hypothetical protein ACUVXI_10400 [bacterium]